jgi:hypothetical protein
MFQVVCVNASGQRDNLVHGQTYTVEAVVAQYYILSGVCVGYRLRGMLQNRFRRVTDISLLQRIAAQVKLPELVS